MGMLITTAKEDDGDWIFDPRVEDGFELGLEMSGSAMGICDTMRQLGYEGNLSDRFWPLDEIKPRLGTPWQSRATSPATTSGPSSRNSPPSSPRARRAAPAFSPSADRACFSSKYEALSLPSKRISHDRTSLHGDLPQG